MLSQTAPVRHACHIGDTLYLQGGLFENYSPGHKDCHGDHPNKGNQDAGYLGCHPSSLGVEDGQIPANRTILLYWKVMLHSIYVIFKLNALMKINIPVAY